MANAASTDIYANSTCVFADDTDDCETYSSSGTLDIIMGPGFFIFFTNAKVFQSSQSRAAGTERRPMASYFQRMTGKEHKRPKVISHKRTP